MSSAVVTGRHRHGLRRRAAAARCPGRGAGGELRRALHLGLHRGPRRPSTAGGLLVEWPPVLRRFLNGTVAGPGRQRRRQPGAARRRRSCSATAPTAPGSRSSTPRAIRSPSTRSVTCAGRSRTPTTASAPRSSRAPGARSTTCASTCGVEAYLNYGALLGAVRDGAMIAHDSDTDVCYLSRHTSPADIIAESYRIQRTLQELGWNLLRMSGGDIKLLLPLSDGRVCHIDIFVAFRVGETFYQLGNRSGRSPSPRSCRSRRSRCTASSFPAPADPEAMLAFIYGPQLARPRPVVQVRRPAARRTPPRRLAARLPHRHGAAGPSSTTAPGATWSASAAPTSRSGSTTSCPRERRSPSSGPAPAATRSGSPAGAVR